MSATLLDEPPHPTALGPLPAQFRDWRGRHAGETIVVCGCGRSLRDLPEPARRLTIGVNDVGRLFDPTYLVVLNPKDQFAGDRFRFVVESRARALFTQLDPRQLPVPHPRIVRFRLGRRSGTDLAGADALPYTRNSPYVAVCLAAFMGARRIGLIGVDFTDHHFFGATGRHALTRELAAIDREYAALVAALARLGVELVNLSGGSRLTALPKADPAAFLDGGGAARAGDRTGDRGEAPGRPLTIVSYATTPVAGVPAILARCISARTPHRARCVWADRGYGNGVTFEGDLEWRRAPREAEAALAEADLVIVHNGKADPRHLQALSRIPVVTMAHNYLWNVDTRFVAEGSPGIVVGQYQATLPEFAGWSVVPNPVPLWEEAFTPGEKSSVPTICYTPSARHERYPEGHRLYWHAKGYDTTMRALDRLAARGGVQIEVVRHGPRPHGEVLAMKRRAHVVIDECVTGSYHRNSLEGLAAGCVVVNAVDPGGAVAVVLRRCAVDAERPPWTFSRLEDLEETLAALIAAGPEALEAQGRASRAWMERHWSFDAQWSRFWEPVVSAALARGRRPRTPARPVATRRSPVMRSARPSVSVARHSISVVVPHGGTDRLPHLATVLASLRQRDAVTEIIVSEMGAAPAARDVAEQWADKYVFTASDGPFERARTLNVGSGVAECDLVLWHDNDLLTEGEFASHAAKELRDRRLDYLIPYTSVRYLPEAESREVMQGGLAPSACRPVSVLYSSRRAPACSGGMGLVKRDFLLRYGGLIEGFRGWGGEDNGWNRKAALLGRPAPTTRNDQHAYHLYHPSSGGYPSQKTGAHNPHYAHNVALLRQILSIRDPHAFLRQFPPPAPAEVERVRMSLVRPRSTTPGPAPAVAPAAASAAGSDASVAGRETSVAGSVTRAIHAETPPVWTYWEGPCPDWIARCRATIDAHAPAVRHLTPETFDALRDTDRDIDLSRLGPAQRADFIRAFLLARYGGLWIDADCVVMRPLAPIVEGLRGHAFVAHRERSGLVSNGFIGAPPGSRLAREFYERLCRILRSRQPIGWTSLGSQPLTEVLNGSTEWHELPCQRIQPICWSEPEAFLARRPLASHDERLDGDALCYMMSNAEMTRRAGAAGQLLEADTFFTFLVDRSLGDGEGTETNERIFGRFVEAYRRYNDESLSGPGSTLAQTVELRERLPLLLQQLGVRSLLDAPCGDFNWMRRVRLGVEAYLGVDMLETLVVENQRRDGAPGRSFRRLDLRSDPLPRMDAVLCRDCLVHLSFAEALAVVRNITRSGARYLLATTFPARQEHGDTSRCEWRPLNLELPPFSFPPPARILYEQCTEAGGAYRDKALGVWEIGLLP